MLKRLSLRKQSSRWKTASLPKALLIVGITVGVATGGFWAYKRFRQQRQEEWLEDPVAAAAEIHQTTDVSAV
jgi:hypothetical protein